MLERIGQVLGPVAMANWGGYWRNQIRQEPDLVECALERLIVRLDNPRPVRDRGAWMGSEYRRGLQRKSP